MKNRSGYPSGLVLCATVFTVLCGGGVAPMLKGTISPVRNMMPAGMVIPSIDNEIAEL